MIATDPPYLVTLGFDPSTFERLDRLRSQWFPPALNQVPAHLSLFHHLPGGEGDAIDRTLREAARSFPAMPLTFATLKRTGRGLMLPVDAPGLAEVRAGLARSFGRWLTPQDRQPFRPHVMIMNKAGRAEVEAAFQAVQAGWTTWSGRGERLILWRYLGGPWEEENSYALSGEAESIPAGRPSPRIEA